MKVRLSFVGLVILFALFISPRIAQANGYKILAVKSAKATAMGEAFIVQADDPSAIAFNPAGLAQLDGEQFSAQVTLCDQFTDYESPSGQTAHNEDQWQAVPALYATTDFGRDDLGAGLGITFPNGLSSEWAEDSFARYVTTYSKLIVADITPALGLRLSDHWMIGGGVDIYYSEANLESMVDLGLANGTPGAMDTKSELKGDGSAVGYNLGAIYTVNPRHGFALTFHAPYTIDYDGDLTMGGICSDMSTSFDFPASVVAGYAFRPSDKWKVEFNADWTQWNKVDDVTIHFDTPGMTDVVNQENLHNTMAYKIGAEYLYSEKLTLRAGYIYNENATPEDTWRPSQPDTDMHFFLAGFGYRFKHVTVDTAFQLVYYEKRTIDNNVDQNEYFSSSSIDGTYETLAPCVSIGATYIF